jgi:hypothetical protein
MAKAKAKKRPVQAKSAKTKKSPKRLAKFRPMNVAVATGSKAEKHYRAMALPLAALIKRQVIAPGLPPTPEHNLINHGGKTIQNLVFTNFYIGGGIVMGGTRHRVDRPSLGCSDDRHQLEQRDDAVFQERADHHNVQALPHIV